ncbi:hypothetical protein DID88_009975 [Monilinia fructigena]|uniref:Uncharacterized protein n=1 Tax=Monilinia fructigena TaxID=38457 RepID=A0A395IK42_9HELO|nr:hypothetical protein DID88_009975 [Monilinia fructigena]
MSGSNQTRQSRARHARHHNNSAGDATIEVVDYDYDGSEAGQYPDAVEDSASEDRRSASVGASRANASRPSYADDRDRYEYRHPRVFGTPPQDHVSSDRDQYRRPRVIITPLQARASPTRNRPRRPRASTRSPRARASPTRNQHSRHGVSTRPPQVRVSYFRADRREDLPPPPRRQYSSRFSPLAHGNPSRQRSPVGRQISYRRRSPSPTSYGGYIPSPPTGEEAYIYRSDTSDQGQRRHTRYHRYMTEAEERAMARPVTQYNETIDFVMVREMLEDLNVADRRPRR